LRRISTSAERILWDRIRNRQAAGFKFVRQEIIGPYIADFVCRDCRVIVELDGASHAAEGRVEHDARRDIYLAGAGYRILRFANDDVFSDVDSVIATIVKECEAVMASSPFYSSVDEFEAGERSLMS
jgi:very-short-patch-repair endonuclease